jgi:hypothetical protein
MREGVETSVRQLALLTLSLFWNWSANEPLYSQVSSIPYRDIDSRLAGRAPGNLATVVIHITAPEPPPALRASSGCELMPGESIVAVQKRVSAFSTLRELDKDEAGVGERWHESYPLATVHEGLRLRADLARETTRANGGARQGGIHQLEHRPLAEERADRLEPASIPLKEALEQVGRASHPPMGWRAVQVRDARLEVLLEAEHGRRVELLAAYNQVLAKGASKRRRGRLVGSRGGLLACRRRTPSWTPRSRSSSACRWPRTACFRPGLRSRLVASRAADPIPQRLVQRGRPETIAPPATVRLTRCDGLTVSA